jgi:hypothetical protein
MKLALLSGILIWVITFIVSIVVFSLRETNRPLFESIMPVTLTILTVVFSIRYFQMEETISFMESILIGVLWYIVNLVIDMIMFLPPSPMQMSFIDYMADIGITYILIPIIPFGFGYLCENRD